VAPNGWNCKKEAKRDEHKFDYQGSYGTQYDRGIGAEHYEAKDYWHHDGHCVRHYAMSKMEAPGPFGY